VIIPTVTAVAAGGVFIASSVQSALVYQRVLTLANLSGKITGLVQALQNERKDTVRFIVLGNSNGGRGASPSSAVPPWPELGLLDQDHAITTGWANQVKALAGRSMALTQRWCSRISRRRSPRSATCRHPRRGDQHPPSRADRDPAVRDRDQHAAAVQSQITVAAATRRWRARSACSAWSPARLRVDSTSEQLALLRRSLRVEPVITLLLGLRWYRRLKGGRNCPGLIRSKWRPR